MKPKTATAPDFFSPQIARARRFYLDLTPPRRSKMVVVCGGIEHCTPDYRIERKTFPFHSIEYVTQGQGQLNLGGRNHELLAGTIFSYGPGISQRIASNPRKPLVKYFADFAGTEAARWLRHSHLPAGTVSRIFPPGEIQPLFEEFIRTGERGTPQAPELCRRLLECIGVKIDESRSPLSGGDSLAFATYQKCRHHIQENFRSLHTLEQIAREQRLDRTYLCRLFQRFDHQSPYQYLMRLKMNAAAAQLGQPGALVKSVAADFGFANPYHFSRVFKSVFGLAPESFRHVR
jgi:AraC-like DNA-binding protein/quercetin dioxygenase-like cupin family protein